jgi:hypothetical protein
VKYTGSDWALAFVIVAAFLLVFGMWLIGRIYGPAP